MAEPTDYGEGDVEFIRQLEEALQANLKKPPKLTLSQWAADYAVLSPETSAQTGRFRAYAYQIGMLDAVTDPAVTQVTVMKSARVGYTKMLDHIVGYFIHQDPSPILLVQPRVEDAEDYSSTEIEPMLRDTPVLAAITGDLKAKDSKQKLLKRVFRNGASISFVGANSPGGFRRITARIILFDEVDGYPVTGAGKEGDQIRLGIRRSQTFWNRKIVLGSTPTVKAESRIEKAFLQSDQRRFYVPCPHCGEYQVLQWGGPDTAHGIKWDKDASGNGVPATAHYVCRASGCVIDEVDKPGMLDAGEWRATAPLSGHAGFHIWTGYSLDPNASWPNLVSEWLEVKDDPLSRQTFINTVLGEPYEDRGDRALAEVKLLERCGQWAGEVPPGVAMITIGVDVQDGRVEIEVVGWGRNEESWSLAYEVIDGRFDEPHLQAELDAFLRRSWSRADGRPFVPEATCIDTGGSHTQAVYEFCKARLGRKVWGIKGASEQGGQRSPVWPTKPPTSRSKSSYRPIILGVNAAKDAIRTRLHIDTPGPGYMHFPADRDLAYFSQLIAERSSVRVSGGKRYRVWELPPGRANEALDCRVYAYAALCGLTYKGAKLNRKADDVGAVYTRHEGGEAEEAPMLPPTFAPAEEADIIVVTPSRPEPPKKRSLASRLA